MRHQKYSLTIVLLVLLSACQPTGNDSKQATGENSGAVSDSSQGSEIRPGTPLNRLALRPIVDCVDLKSRFVDNWAESLLQSYRTGTIRPVILPAAADSRAMTMETSADAPEQVSATNVQESGVDEADYIKADAEGNLYIAHQGWLLIERAFPPSAMIQLAELELGGQIHGIYLEADDEILVALVNRQGPLYRGISPGGGPIAAMGATVGRAIIIDEYKPAFDIVVVDVSNRSAPEITERIRIDGWLVGSRRVGGRMHLLSQQNMYPYRWLQVTAEIQALLDRYRKSYVADDEAAYTGIADEIKSLLLAQIDTGTLAEILPQVAYPELPGDLPRVVLDCDAVFAPEIGLVKNGFMTMTSLDLDGDNLSQIGLLGNGWLTYATGDAFFLAQNSSGWWWSERQLQQSVIHQMEISSEAPSYVGSGLVPGHINDSFSMSYRDDVLRVATTTFGRAGPAPANESANHLLVLRHDGAGILETVGAVNDFAPGEQIYSTRFFHDKAFIVTFRRIDPLFAFDLSSPENPRIVSELKIPGFSNYIHAIDADTLLTIGRDGDDAGATDDIAVKLFDVSDLSAMRMLDSYVPNTSGYSSSSANWDHHAFTYYAPLDLLSIPVLSSDRKSGEYFSGIIALDINLDAGKISELGRVDHADLLPQACAAGVAWLCATSKHSAAWLTQPNRSIVMQSATADYLFTVSNLGLKATSLDNFDLDFGSLLFPARAGIDNYYLY